MKCQNPGVTSFISGSIRTGGHDDNDQQYNDADDQAHPHLHIFPPHLLPDSVRTTPETLGRHRKVVGLVL